MMNELNGIEDLVDRVQQVWRCYALDREADWPNVQDVIRVGNDMIYQDPYYWRNMMMTFLFDRAVQELARATRPSNPRALGTV